MTVAKLRIPVVQKVLNAAAQAHEKMHLGVEYRAIALMDGAPN